MVDLNKISKEEFGKFVVPEKIYKFEYRDQIERLYTKLYFDNIRHTVFANIFVISVCLSLFVFWYMYGVVYSMDLFNHLFYKFHTKFAVMFGLWFLINVFIYYLCLFFYFFMHESKFRKNEAEIEKDLPEFIDNLVSNLKGGISLEKALLKSIGFDQKALKYEVTLINQKIMMGTNVYQALREFRERFDSEIINRTFFLIEEGVKGGGNLAAPLERISENLKRIYMLNDEIKASSGGFSIVIRVITILVAPLLFALALTLLNFIGNLFKLIASAGSDIISVSEIPIEFGDYLTIFSYSMIFLITFYSSLITSELKNEKIHESIKYLPIFVVLAIILFRIFTSFLLGMFGNIF